MLQVDAVIGQEEIVVKSLGDLLTGHPVLRGVTIRGTGASLILDIPGVVEAHAGRALSGGGPRFQPTTTSLERPRRPPSFGCPPCATQGARPVRRRLALSVRKIAEKELTNLGTDVTTAVDGLDAMSKLREGHYDLIFTDLEVAHARLRFHSVSSGSCPAYQDLPMSHRVEPLGQKHQDQACALGCTDYLTKPFNARQLEGALEKYGPRRSPSALRALVMTRSRTRKTRVTRNDGVDLQRWRKPLDLGRRPTRRG